MAYTTAPEKQTYSTERLAACYSIDLRDFTASIVSRTDAGMVNLVPKHMPEAKALLSETRAPLLLTRIENSSSAMRGIYIWQKTLADIYYFAVVGVKVFTSQDAKIWTNVDTLLTALTTPVGFTEFIDSTNTKKLVLVDGVEGYVYTTASAGTKITDVDFPTPHLPFPVFIDGYLFLAKKSTGDIYNSNLNDPAAWTAGDFISSELYPDDVQAIAKVNNYLIAIGAQGCEFFYDASNATASPLARYEAGSLPFGCSYPYSMAVNKNTLVFLANNSDGEVTLKIIEDFKHMDINPTWLLPLLNLATAGTGAVFGPGSAASPNTVYGYFLRQGGELYYVLRISGTDLTNTNFPVFAFAFSSKTWIQLTSNYAVDSESGFVVTCSAFGTNNDTISFVGGNYSGLTLPYPFFGIFGHSLVYKTPFNLTQAYDQLYDLNSGPGTLLTAGVGILTELRTPISAFGTLNTKTNSRFGIAAITSEAATVSVSYSDADYASYSTARDLVLTATTQFPFITQLGQFRQRSYKVTYQGAAFVKYTYFETDINKGQQ